MFGISGSAGVTSPNSPIVSWVDIRPGSSSSLARETRKLGAPSRNRSPIQGYAASADSREVFPHETWVTGASLRLGLNTYGNQPERQSAPSQSSTFERHREVDRVASERVRLLAAKYAAGEVSKEVLARLAILDQRMLSLSPVVSLAQVTALEKVASDLESLRRQQQARKARSRV